MSGKGLTGLATVQSARPSDSLPAVTPSLAVSALTVRVWDERAADWRVLLSDVDWWVRPGEHWAVLGPNGAGKTTLLATVAGVLKPHSGTVSVLGKPVGAPGMRDPRAHIGLIESAPRSFAARLSPVDVVLKGVSGSVAAQGHRATEAERRRAVSLLQWLGCAALINRRYQDCSRGERQRILIARAMMRRPHLLLLDEPTTGLDLPGREQLLSAMAALADELAELATVTVTHHLEELPASTTHALLIRDGRVASSGPVGETLTAERLSECFGMAVGVQRTAGRWMSHAIGR